MTQSIGEVINARARSLGMSRKELGRRLNLTPSAICHMMKRSTLDVELLVRIGVALDYDFIAHYLYFNMPASSMLAIRAAGREPKLVPIFGLRARIQEAMRVTQRMAIVDPSLPATVMRADLELVRIILNDLWDCLYYHETFAYDKTGGIPDSEIGEQSHSGPQNRFEQTKNG